MGVFIEIGKTSPCRLRVESFQHSSQRVCYGRPQIFSQNTGIRKRTGQGPVTRSSDPLERV